MKKEQFIELAEKYANGTATEEEMNTVESFYTAVQEKQKNLPIQLGENKKNKIYDSIAATIFKKKSSYFNSKRVLTMAASFLLVMGIGYAYLQTQSPTIITVTSAKGERKEIQLADSSKVFLNANSSISYADNFKENRHLSLNGEAFFSVTKNPNKPFTVAANNLTTRVLGTSFNIKSTSKEKTIVSVNTGKVLVTSLSNPNARFYLIKNQQVTMTENTHAQLTYHNSEDLMAWTKNIIFLDNETLANTATILENWYDVKIDFENQSFTSETLSGKFKEEQLPHILSSIALLKNLEIEYLTPKHILIRKKKSH
ncbi:FecR family protein [Flavobacterium sp. UMI-01]|uniref:FecR family protein n=1 Tax=Flavobacterium sp. UMI-01 TaxID=1441053 RepID=UPI001C7D46DE|nr:FecR domain-containing protein [Flavobacterium sp. UMI-01]GIZ07558.1 hypothetical protein FUMI01_02850 [Flavobacterium sp. UMI-01]